jgi:putative endonuclease
MWYMYVVKCSDDSLYTGITTEPERRLHEHNNTKKGAKYTRARRPVKLVYCINYPDRSTASKAEASFKKFSRKQKLKMINSSEVKEGDLLFQRRMPGGECLLIEVWDNREVYTKKLNEEAPGAVPMPWPEHDFPILRVLHPTEGLITDPSYYYETYDNQRSRHAIAVKMLSDYLEEE